jgi:hypothetical protein
MGMPDVLFKGIPNAHVRVATRDLIRATRPEVVVIPCAGAFASAIAAIDAGMRPEEIVCGDIALYTSVIGAWLAGDDMRIVAKGEFEWLNAHMSDPRSKMAAVVLAIRILQYDKPALHYQHRKRELIERAEVYLAQIAATAERAMSKLKGLRYDARDLWVTLGEFRDNERALLLVDPPWYKSGYANMFKGVDLAFDWDAPRVGEFDPNDAQRLTEWLGSGAATSFVYRGIPAKETRDPAAELGPPWRSVFMHRPAQSSSSVVSWIVSNKPTPIAGMQFKRDDVEEHVRPRYRMYDGRTEIHEGDRLTWRNEKRDVVNYYRDLLVHRLALSATEDYRVLLLNGELIACIGFHVASIRTGGGVSQATLTFAFSPHSDRYPKLNKLVLMCAVSSWMWDGVMKDIEEPPKRIATAMLTAFPESKIARGVMKLTAKEWQTDKRMFKLTYHADVVKRTPDETLRLWLEKYATNRETTTHAATAAAG